MVYGSKAPPFLTSELDGTEWSVSRVGRLALGERASGTHWTGGGVGGHYGVKKNLPCFGKNLLAVCKLRLSPAFWCRDINIYFLCRVFTFRLTSSLRHLELLCFSLRHLYYHPTELHHQHRTEVYVPHSISVSPGFLVTS
jgi:hypothetical protein